MGKLICLNEFFGGALVDSFIHINRGIAFHSRPLEELETVLYTLLSAQPFAPHRIRIDPRYDGLERDIIQMA